MKSGELSRQSDLAYRELRSQVIRCKLAPGTEMSEASLAAKLGYGKAAVRAALMQLCQEGLAQVVPRRGYFVTPITVKDVHEIFELRMVIEPAIARLAAGKVNEKALIQADMRWRKSDSASSRQVVESALKANKDFHITIAQATGNKRLVEMQARLLDEMERLIYLGLPIASDRAEIRSGHKPLIKALLRGDSAQAEQSAIGHVQAAKAIVIDAVMSSSNIMQAELTVQREKTGTGA